MDERAIHLKKRKFQLWELYTRLNNSIDFAMYTTCRNKLRTLTRKKKPSPKFRKTADIKDKGRSKSFLLV